MTAEREWQRQKKSFTGVQCQVSEGHTVFFILKGFDRKLTHMNDGNLNNDTLLVI